MKYAFVVTALLASVTIAAGRQPQFKSGVEVAEAFEMRVRSGQDNSVTP